MIKILVEQQENGSGNKATILEPTDGLKAVDALTTLASPVMNLILEATDNKRKESIEVLTALLDSYIETNNTDVE